LLPQADFQEPSVDKAELITPLCSGDLQADIATCLHSLAKVDLQAFCVTKTRPDLGLSVVQGIVPGCGISGRDCRVGGCMTCPLPWAG